MTKQNIEPDDYNRLLKDIKEQVREKNPYWNNVVSWTLKRVDRDHGREVAEKLMRDANLDQHGWEI